MSLSAEIIVPNKELHSIHTTSSPGQRKMPERRVLNSTVFKTNKPTTASDHRAETTLGGPVPNRTGPTTNGKQEKVDRLLHADSVQTTEKTTADSRAAASPLPPQRERSTTQPGASISPGSSATTLSWTDMPGSVLSRADFQEPKVTGSQRSPEPGVGGREGSCHGSSGNRTPGASPATPLPSGLSSVSLRTKSGQSRQARVPAEGLEGKHGQVRISKDARRQRTAASGLTSASGHKEEASEEGESRLSVMGKPSKPPERRSRMQNLLARRRGEEPASAKGGEDIQKVAKAKKPDVVAMLDVRVRALDMMLRRAFPEESLTGKSLLNPRRFQRDGRLQRRLQEAQEVLGLQELLVRLTGMRDQPRLQRLLTGQLSDTSSEVRKTPEGQSSEETGEREADGEAQEPSNAKPTTSDVQQTAEEKSPKAATGKLRPESDSPDEAPDRTRLNSEGESASDVAPHKANGDRSSTAPRSERAASEKTSKKASKVRKRKRNLIEATYGVAQEPVKGKKERTLSATDAKSATTTSTDSGDKELQVIESLLQETGDPGRREVTDEQLLEEMALMRSGRCEALISHSESCLRVEICTKHARQSQLWQDALKVIATRRLTQRRLEYLRTHAPALSERLEKQKTSKAKAAIRAGETRINENGGVVHPDDFQEEELKAMQREQEQVENGSSQRPRLSRSLSAGGLWSSHAAAAERNYTRSRHVGEAPLYGEEVEDDLFSLPPLQGSDPPAPRKPRRHPKPRVSQYMLARIADLEAIYGSDFLVKVCERLRQKIRQVRVDLDI